MHMVHSGSVLPPILTPLFLVSVRRSPPIFISRGFEHPPGWVALFPVLFFFFFFLPLKKPLLLLKIIGILLACCEFKSELSLSLPVSYFFPSRAGSQLEEQRATMASWIRRGG